MGMPITTYNVLNALDKGEPEYEIRAAQTALEPFNLFAFIIHDPKAHPEFDRSIRSDFNWLDYITGQELLFFALVDPPDAWLNEGRNRGMDRHYYKELQVFERETQALFNPKNAITSPDKNITAFSLANGLGISYDNLPCLVITPDFRSEHFIWVKTSSIHIEEQLTKLGYIASRIENIPPGTSSLEIIKKEIDSCKISGIRSLASSIAKRLANIMSCFVARDNSAAHERAQNTINELRTNLRHLKRNINERNTEKNEGDKEKLDNLCLQIILSLSQLNLVTSDRISQRDTLNLNSFIEANHEFLEPDSHIMLKTTNMVLSPLLDRTLGFEVDYTPGVICLAKVFEREVNLSVVHWIRERLGVRLPLYFNKYDPKKQAKFDGVNFNHTRDNQTWSPPTMGRSLEAVQKKWSEEKWRPTFSPLQKKWLQFLNRWRKINEARNTAAHTMELVNERSVRAVCNAFQDLSKMDLFRSMFELKSNYRQT